MKTRSVIIIFSSFILILLKSCSSSKTVRLKYQNGSTETFKQLEVDILGKKYYFEDVKPNETANIITVANTYRYHYTKVITDKDTLIAQPRDFMNEKLYTDGSRRMVLKIMNSGSDRILIFEGIK